MSAAIDFVVVRYGGAVSQVVADIEATVKVPYTLTLVDNTDDNRGWTAASDEAAMRRRSTLVCFVNPDTRLGPGWLEPILEVFERPEVVMAGPSSLVPSSCEWWGVGERMVGGWLMVVRRQWYERHRLDRGYFLMFADTDLNRTAIEDGAVIAYLDGLPVRHATAGYEPGGWKQRWLDKDGAQYRQKWHIPEPRRLTVGAAIIYRDEDLARTLGSLGGSVDEAVLVNTQPSPSPLSPSSDWPLVTVGWRPWDDDFAAARNASIKPATADWLFYIDADEALVEDYPGALRKWVQAIPGCYAELAVHCMADDGSVTEVSWQRRLWRNGRGIHFEGRVHEQLVGPPVTKKWRLTDVHIEHWGYAASDGRKQAKSERNRRLLALAIRDAPDNPYYMAMLGQQLAVDGSYGAALAHLLRAIGLVRADMAKHGHAGYGALLWATASATACMLGRWSEAAELAVHCPSGWVSADLLYNAGVAWDNLGARREAKGCFWRCLRERFEVNDTDPSMSSWRPWLALAQIAHFEGGDECARRCLDRALEQGGTQPEVKAMEAELQQARQAA